MPGLIYPARRPEYDSADFKRMWHSTMTLSAIATVYFVSPVAIRKAGLQRGFTARNVLRAARKDAAARAAASAASRTSKG